MSSLDRPLPLAEDRILSLAEAKRAGESAHQLSRLRDGLNGLNGASGSLTIQTAHGSSSIALDANAQVAVLSLLIERESVLLTGLGVSLAEPFLPN